MMRIETRADIPGCKVWVEIKGLCDADLNLAIQHLGRRAAALVDHPDNPPFEPGSWMLVISDAEQGEVLFPTSPSAWFLILATLIALQILQGGEAGEDWLRGFQEDHGIVRPDPKVRIVRDDLARRAVIEISINPSVLPTRSTQG